ncbi:hypothetical protein BC937DRAFT_91699 [Endogone sp. FLAS-F59071]|nr:hypothetical protein BC937DRAFT_91699 [Endogone sp. FLAS-F59071]|eukprot:RUS21727.1 hypothetical protein BC937DRAFT_91699 [Endogone sp. FLAS-F59071]
MFTVAWSVLTRHGLLGRVLSSHKSSVRRSCRRSTISMEEALKKARQGLKKTTISRDASDGDLTNLRYTLTIETLPNIPAALPEEDIAKINKKVMEADLQHWDDILRDHTFKTQTIALSRDEAAALVAAGEINLGQRKGAVISSSERTSLDGLESKIEETMQRWDFDNEQRGWFVKTSRRSPKDAVVVGERMFELFKKNWEETLYKKRKQKRDTGILEDGDSHLDENAKITALLQAGRDCLKIITAKEAMTLLTNSERVFGDIESILEEQPETTTTSFDCFIVLRKWEYIPIEYEFRCFVNEGKMNAISQYDSIVFFESYSLFLSSLPLLKSQIRSAITAYHVTTIQPLLTSSAFPSADRYVIDFAFVGGDLSRPVVIEINPFFNADGCLFNFSKDREILAAALLAFWFGYLTSYLELVNKVYDIVNELPSTTHKVLTSQFPARLFCSRNPKFTLRPCLIAPQRYLLYVLLGLSILFVLILIPLERIASYESRRNVGYPYRTSAREHLQRRGSF